VLIDERNKWGFGSKAILQRLREEHSDIDWPARSAVDGLRGKRVRGGCNSTRTSISFLRSALLLDDRHTMQR
jgi:hypothetical protein